jgi:enterochelin esterase-like enzyme
MTTAMVTSVVLVAAQSPIVRGGDVTFVVAGDRSDPPHIVADFNGWAGGAMTPSADGRTFTLRTTLDRAARIEYLVAFRDRFALDPGNPRSVASPAGLPRSELLMPDYRPPAPLAQPQRRGRIEEFPFASRAGERRRIRVYVPRVGPAKAGLPVLPGESRIPSPGRGDRSVLYVHDGDIVLNTLDLPALLDTLIDRGEMAPVVAVFIDSIDRHDDYEPGSPFRAVLVNEILPGIEQRYGSANGQRAILGLSRSTVGALDACSNGGVAFDACLLVAPAVAPAQFVRVLPPTRTTTRFALASGTYDIPLVADARALRDEMQRRGLSVRYSELPQGHNHTAFRAALPALLQSMFPLH